jgi:glyoxylase-like metal-dependent hydrolase (beta-lactamase superfamily II)
MPTGVIDIGFTAASDGRRGRKLTRDLIDALALVGVEAAKVEDVILTHMHYDHVGNFHRFPVARLHLQEPEMHYAVGRDMKHPQLAKSFEPDDVCGVVRLTSTGAWCIAPGRAMWRRGFPRCRPAAFGGTAVVKVNTRRGVVVWRRT